MNKDKESNQSKQASVNSDSQKKSIDMTVSVLKRGKDFNDYEIKNSLSGQTSRTRVVFLAD
jgi:hypothetical protein